MDNREGSFARAYKETRKGNAGRRTKTEYMAPSNTAMRENSGVHLEFSLGYIGGNPHVSFFLLIVLQAQSFPLAMWVARRVVPNWPLPRTLRMA